MSKKLLMVLAAVFITAVFVLPAGAQFCGPFGFGGFSPFGTSVATGFTTVSSFTSGFTSVNGVAVPFSGCGFGVPFGGCGFGTGLGFGGFSPFGFC